MQAKARLHLSDLSWICWRSLGVDYKCRTKIEGSDVSLYRMVNERPHKVTSYPLESHAVVKYRYFSEIFESPNKM